MHLSAYSHNLLVTRIPDSCSLLPTLITYFFTPVSYSSTLILSRVIYSYTLLLHLNAYSCYLFFPSVPDSHTLLPTLVTYFFTPVPYSSTLMPTRGTCYLLLYLTHLLEYLELLAITGATRAVYFISFTLISCLLEFSGGKMYISFHLHDETNFEIRFLLPVLPLPL